MQAERGSQKERMREVVGGERSMKESEEGDKIGREPSSLRGREKNRRMGGDRCVREPLLPDIFSPLITRPHKLGRFHSVRQLRWGGLLDHPRVGRVAGSYGSRVAKNVRPGRVAGRSKLQIGKTRTLYLR